MRVLGLLNFYDEKPEHLTAAVTSLALAGIDHVIAVDGAYRLFPDGQATSHRACHEALVTAALDEGIGCTLHLPSAVWENNEVQKRTAMFAIAHGLAEPGEDWLFVLDADEVIVEATGLHDALAATDLDVASIRHGEPSVRPRAERRLFRAHPRGITVKSVHYHYVDGDQRVLWGPRQVDRVMLEQVRVLHTPLSRTRERNAARNRYYEDRLITRAEPELFV